MNNSQKIKTHFDIKIILLFMTVFIFSCVLFLYKKQIQSICTVEGFKIEATSLRDGQLITFSDTTVNSFDWKWDFGDNSKESYLSKTNHTFENPGSYNVKLTINNICTVEKQIKILPNYSNEESSLYPIIKAPESGVQGRTVQFNDLSKNATSWEWCFNSHKGFKVDSKEKNPKYTYSTSGSKTISLIINGDQKHIKTVPIFISKPEPKEDEPAPPPPPQIPKPTIGGLNEEKLISGLLGISKNTLDYRNFAFYFCKKRMPQVNINDQKTVSLKEMDEEIRGKKIKIKKVAIQKDGDCVVFISINYK